MVGVSCLFCFLMVYGFCCGVGGVFCLGGDVDVLDVGWLIFEIELGKSYCFWSVELNLFVVFM